MSFANAVVPPLEAGRRSHARRRIDGLAYVEFGPDNGAILIDVGEGGLAFQSVMPVIMNQALLFKFRTPGGGDYIEGFGEVAWINDSGKGGGLRFVELNEPACAQIREWAAVLPEAEGGVSKDGVGSEPGLADEKSSERAPIDATLANVAAVPSNEDKTTASIAEPPAAVEAANDASIDAPAALPAADQSDAKPAPVHQATLPAISSIPEFTIEIAPAPESDPSLPSQPQAAPIFVSPVATASAVVAARDPKTLAPAQKPRRKPSSATVEPPVPSVYRQDSIAQPSFIQRTPSPASAGTEWNNLKGHADESKPHAMLPQALKVGIGAAAGAGLVLALVLGVPYLRTRVQATANARSNASNLVTASPFEVEVADVNNRRWILRSGGEAGSPFGETPSRRETQFGTANDSRRDSGKTARSDADNSNDADRPQPKLAKPDELALSRPRANPTGATSAQLMAPSIFDGITPPIGTVSDRLAAGGPEAPGIVSPDSQPAVRKSALQAAVLVQRVPPIYPPNALQSQVEGQVLVNATIGRDGIPKNLKVVRGDQRLVAAALAAIGQWRYRPATLGGEPIDTQIDITIDFNLK
jgi:TonB family protein